MSESSATRASVTGAGLGPAAVDPGSLGWSESHLAAVAASIGRDSELVKAAARVRKRPDNVLR
ncbi:MAG: hypothetical protein ACOCZK_04915, partial [Planctomycetota bacterium]